MDSVVTDDIDALVMCGGRGTRLDTDVEKPLFEVGGQPMVTRVRDALRASQIETIYAVSSPHTPETREFLDGPHIEAPGEGYVADLQYALDQIEPPVLTVAADLPLLTGEVVDRVLDAYTGDSLTVCVPAALKELLGVSIDTTMSVDGREVAPTGLNIVGHRDAETTFMTYDARVAVNVNRLADAQLAEELLAPAGGSV